MGPVARLSLGAAALLATGCAAERAPIEPSTAMAEMSASAPILSRAGRNLAQATATQIGDSIRIRLAATSLPAGAYGAHIHAVGRCDAPDYASAGPHWNPTGQEHGRSNPRGMHKGDLPNLTAGVDGTGVLEITIPGAWLAGGPAPMLDGDGAALVIHERPDDYRTDPSGNSGARIACGVFR